MRRRVILRWLADGVIVQLVAAAMLLSLAAAGPARAGRETISIPVTEPQPATITGDLYTPSGKGPYPAVVLLHGCGGVSPNVPAWAQWLQSEGYAALVVNSFQGRGLRNLCADSRPLMPAVRASDVYAAAAKLTSMGVVDGDRIAAMGFSHGGGTVLTAWRTQSKHPDVKLRALIAFYPGCGNRRLPPDAAPLLILAGGKDDWTPAENCQKLADAAREAGRPITIVVYPDARHHFDGAHLKKLVFVSIAKGGKGATIEYNPKAHEDAEKQVKQFLAAQLKLRS
jgi:dienelactone hydrolase